jgi:hypothetical protein
LKDNETMSGIQFVTDEKGRKVAVQIDLKKHRELWEDIEDVLSLGRGGTKSGFRLTR